MDIQNMRITYDVGTFDESQVNPDPFMQFRQWLETALATNLTEPHGMTLSTVSASGRPSSRVVLLRGFDSRGFVFFTNYQSRKGQEIESTGFACINFWWPTLHRQVRVEGQMEKVEPELSDSYFASRPYDSQVASAASPQSQIITSREVLDERISNLKSQYPQTMPRPLHWGGFRLKPDYFEFWQGRPSRLHDRITYTLRGGDWVIARLAP